MLQHSIASNSEKQIVPPSNDVFKIPESELTPVDREFLAIAHENPDMADLEASIVQAYNQGSEPRAHEQFGGAVIDATRTEPVGVSPNTYEIAPHLNDIQIAQMASAAIIDLRNNHLGVTDRENAKPNSQSDYDLGA